MNGTALALIVTGALLHATWNLLAKKAAGGAPFVWLYGVVSLAAASPLVVIEFVNGTAAFGVSAWLAIAVSAAAHLVYSLTLQQGYRASDFSVVYPVARGTGPLFAVLGAIVLLGERPTLLGGLGIVLILLGIAFVADVLAGVRAHASKARAGILWGGMTGVSIAAYTVVDGWAVHTLAIAPIAYYAFGLLLRTLFLAPAALRRTSALCEQWRSNGRLIVAVGILSPTAYLLVLYAMQSAPVSYVAPTRELSMLLGVLFGARVLRERLSASRIAGTMLLLAGVTCLAVAK